MSRAGHEWMVENDGGRQKKDKFLGDSIDRVLVSLAYFFYFFLPFFSVFGGPFSFH